MSLPRKNVISTIALEYLKALITFLHLPSDVAFHEDNKSCVEHIHILALIKGRLTFSSKFVTFWGVKRGQGVQSE